MTIYRTLTDKEWMNGKVRGMAAGMTPATCRFFTSMRPGDRGTSIRLTSNWQYYVKAINTPKGFQYARGTRGGWVNTPPWPVVQVLGFENEFFQGEKVDDKWVMAYTNKLSDSPLDVKPYTVQRWWNIKRNGVLMPGKTFKDQARIILISVNGYLFVPSNRVVVAG